ncbi:MAG TPA: hypothetical protein VFP90_07920, partial [Gemmatimonadaceae bacterium]|nr:hypothetical protein [Gemmatimonadaceae bacterium]
MREKIAVRMLRASADGICFAPRTNRAARATARTRRFFQQQLGQSPTTTRDGMTRIGFAYNQKPETTAAPVALVSAPSAESPGDEEPPSSAAANASDIYAEWDSAETIDAVAAALAPLGDVIRLEADESFPERLRAERPDIVFNIAEGLYGANREAHVPAICEFFDIPYSGSDPFTLSLCLQKGRTKDVLRANNVPTAPFCVIDS